MARRFAKVLGEESEEAFFYPSDLVNTNTTIHFPPLVLLGVKDVTEITHSFYAVAMGYHLTSACSCEHDLCIGETPHFTQITVRPTLFCMEASFSSAWRLVCCALCSTLRLPLQEKSKSGI